MKILQNLSCDKKIALKISLIYSVASICWIVFSDQLLLELVHEPTKLTLLQSLKGWFFVVFTASMLFVLFQKEIHANNSIEIKLRKNERRLNETQKIAKLGSWELDIASNNLWWSDETYRIFGFEIGDETAFERFINSIHSEDRENVTNKIKESIKEITPLKLDYRIILPKGDVRYVHEESRTIYNESLCEPEKRIGSVQDVTEQIKMEEERENLIENLENSLEEIKTLRGIIPICSYCKKIRDDKGAWDILEAYICKHSEAQFSHGVCPECYKKQKGH